MSKEFGDKLKKHMRHGDQTRLADLLGIQPQAVQQWTAGKTEPELNKLPGISKFINVPESELIKWLYEEETNQLKQKQPNIISQTIPKYGNNSMCDTEDIDDLLKTIGANLKSATVDQLLAIQRILKMENGDVSKTNELIELIERFIKEITNRK